MRLVLGFNVFSELNSLIKLCKEQVGRVKGARRAGSLHGTSASHERGTAGGRRRVEGVEGMRQRVPLSRGGTYLRDRRVSRYQYGTARHLDVLAARRSQHARTLDTRNTRAHHTRTENFFRARGPKPIKSSG